MSVRYMMGTTAIHKLGDISSDVQDRFTEVPDELYQAAIAALAKAVQP